MSRKKKHPKPRPRTIKAQGCFKVLEQAAHHFGNDPAKVLIADLKRDTADVNWKDIEISLERTSFGFVYNWTLR